MAGRGWLLALTLGCAPAGAPPSPPPPAPYNVVVLVVDDWGIGSYAPTGTPTPVPTPHLDALASGGVLFERMWAHPVCSPSRAAMMTGRLPFRYGIGAALASYDRPWELPLSEVTLAEALAPYGYASAAVGKWHLGSLLGSSGADHARAQGFDHHYGTVSNLQDLGGGGGSYTRWEKVEDGALREVRRYATTVTADDAITAMDRLPEPFLLWVGFHAAHLPLHLPPAHLVPGGLPRRPKDHDRFVAMVQALDTEVGRVLDALRTRRDRTVVVLVGDNGEDDVAWGPGSWFEGRSFDKGTVAEGGTRVPLVVVAPDGVRGGRTDALVTDVDVFPTLLELVGVPDSDPVLSGLDGQSVADLVRDPSLPGVREAVSAEWFQPNGSATPPWIQEMVTDGRHKLIRNGTGEERLFDLDAAWPEGEDLLAAGHPDAPAIRDALTATLEALHAPR